MGSGSVKSFAKRLAPLVVVAASVVAWVLRAVIAGWVVRLVAIPAVQAQLPGLSVHCAEVTTNLVSHVEFAQLTVEYCRDGACLKATIPAARLSYPLAGLFPWRGLASALPRFAVELDSPAISGQLPSRRGSSAGAALWPLPPLPILPAITIKDASLDLAAPRVSVRGKGIGLSAPMHLPGDQSPFPVTLNGPQLAVSVAGFPRQEGPVSVAARYRPGRIEVSEVTFAGSLLLTEAVVESDATGVRFAAGLHLLRSSGQLRGAVEGQRETLAFHLAQGDIARLAGAAGAAPPVSGELQAEGQLSMTVGQPKTLSGEIKATVRDGVWEGAAIDRLELAARAGRKTLFVDRLIADAGGNHLAVSGGETPLPSSGTKAWQEMATASKAKAELRIAEIDKLPPSWVAPIRAHWQALGLEHAAVQLSLAAGKLTVATAEAAGKAGVVKATKGTLDLSKTMDDWMSAPWSVEWQADLNDAAVVRYFWGDWPATGGSATGQGAFSGTLAEPHLPFTATFTGASVYGVSFRQVAGRLEWTKDRLAIDAAADNPERDRVVWNGAIDLAKGRLVKTRIETSITDLHHYFPNELFPDFDAGGTFAGTATLDGEFSRLAGGIKAAGDWVVDGVPVAGAEADIALAGERWAFRRAKGIVNNTVSVDAVGTMTPDSGWDRFQIDADELSLTAQGQTLALVQPGGISISRERIAVRTPFSLSGAAGTLRFSGAIGGKERLVIAGEGIRDTGLIHRLWGKEVGFSGLDFTVEAGGAPARPEWRCHGAIRGLAAAGAPLALSGRFDLASDQQGLWIKQCELGDGGQTVVFSGHLPLSLRNGVTLLPQPFSLEGHILLPEAGILPQLLPEWVGASGQVRADLALAGTWEHPQGQIRLDADGVKPGTRWQRFPPGPFGVHGALSVSGDRLAISAFELSSPGFSIDTAGAVDGLSLAALIAGRKADFDRSRLDLSGRFGIGDLGWLAPRIKGIRRTGGQAKGTFAVGGTSDQPEIRAALSVTNGELRGGDSLLVARDIMLEAALDRDRLTISSLSGTLGGAPVHGGGTITGLWTPEPVFDLDVDGKDLLLYRADGVKVRADAVLKLGGPLQTPELSGEVRLTDSRVTRKVNWLALLKPGARRAGLGTVTLFSFPDPPLKDTRFNVRIKSARPMVITNNVYKGGVRPNLVLAGTGELPFLTGEIYADSGLVTLPSGRLDMERGLLRFTDASPERPSLELQASGRMMGYDVNAQVSGPYDEPEVTLSSSPSLSNEDLLMLLLTGRPPVNGTAANNSMSSMAVYFGRGLLTRLLGGEEETDRLLLDRLEVDVGRAVTLQGEPTVDARLKLAESAWKKDTSLYLTGEKDIWDYYNAGVRVVFRFQ